LPAGESPWTAGTSDQPVDLATWERDPATFDGAKVTGSKATLANPKSTDWSFLVNKEETADRELGETITIVEPAKEFRFFGQSWSAWPNPAWSDGGFEAAFLLRAGKQPFRPVPAMPSARLLPRPTVTACRSRISTRRSRSSSIRAVVISNRCRARSSSSTRTV